MGALVNPVHRGIIGIWRQSRMASLCSLAVPFKGLPALATETPTTGIEAAAVVAAEPVKALEVTAASPVSVPAEKKVVQARLEVLRQPDHGLHNQLIPRSTWKVLHNLHDAGFETYLVGGSVRDLLLKQVPKDFDVLSTANPKEVKLNFKGRCLIVGKRFPICLLYTNGKITEVSSFGTKVRVRKKDRHKALPKPKDETQLLGTEGWDDRDFARWENSHKRDFTINGLMYDPFQQVVYDYIGGLRDLKKSKVRTVIPAEDSFLEDSARILRAIRIAARLNFSFTKSTGQAIRNQRFSVLKLNKGRLMSEVHMYFAYGVAESSVRLLWRYGILELILPLQAAYFVSKDFRRRDVGSNLLLALLANLDRMVAPDRPCHGSLWVALLAFHLAVSKQTRTPVVVSAAALSIYHANSRRRAAQKAIKIHLRFEKERSNTAAGYVELAEVTFTKEQSIIDEAFELLEAVKASLNCMLDPAVAAEAMQKLVGAEPEDSMIVAQAYSQKAFGLFRGATRDVEEATTFENENETSNANRKVNPATPEAVTRGDTEALGYLFSRIVLNTLYPRPKKAV